MPSTPLTTRFRFGLVLALTPFLSTLILAQPAASAENGRSMMIAQLIERAIEQGQVPVIVGLNLPDNRDGRLEAAGFRNLSSRAIAELQMGMLDQLTGYDVGPITRFSHIPFLAMHADAAALQQLASLPGIASIAEDSLRWPTLKESTALIGASSAWNFGYSGAGQTVAVLDSGVDRYHPFLAGKVVEEGCFSTSAPALAVHSLCPSEAAKSTVPNSALDCGLASGTCSHGTHVAGIIAGKGGTYSGVAPDASLIAVQVFSRIDSQAACQGAPSCISAFDKDILLGLEYVYELRNSQAIAAVNMSLGGDESFGTDCDAKYPAYAQIIELLKSAGIGTIIASGNEYAKKGISAPACISSAVSVGSTTDGSGGTFVDQVSQFSNSGPQLSLLAPGEWITSSVPGGAMLPKRGTSMAAPHVAGAWALLKSKSPDAGVNQILLALRSTGVKITDPKNGVVVPRIQLDKALDAVPAPNRAALTVSPANCLIPNGEEYCTVRLAAVNPLSSPLQIWVQHQADPQPRMVLGTFTDKTFSFGWSWAVWGKSVFYLYDVSENPRRLLARAEVNTQFSPPSIRANPPSCQIDPANATCSVIMTIYNPSELPLQLLVRDRSGLEKAVTGTILEKSYQLAIPWIQAGTYFFTLYDLSGAVPIAVERVIVAGFSR